MALHPPKAHSVRGDANDRITLVLDLDSTLIYSFDLSIPPLCTPLAGDELDWFVITTNTSTCVVYKRPGLDDFLKKESCRFNLACFSAGSRDYVSQILQHLDPQGTIFKGAVYSREQCSFIAELGITKDLSILCKPLSRIVLVDDCLANFFLHPCNGIPVTPFAPSSRYPLANDSLLSASLPCLLDALEAQPDVRPFLNSIFPIAAYFQRALSVPCSDRGALAESS